VTTNAGGGWDVSPTQAPAKGESKRNKKADIDHVGLAASSRYRDPHRNSELGYGGASETSSKRVVRDKEVHARPVASMDLLRNLDNLCTLPSNVHCQPVASSADPTSAAPWINQPLQNAVVQKRSLEILRRVSGGSMPHQPEPARDVDLVEVTPRDRVSNSKKELGQVCGTNAPDRGIMYSLDQRHLSLPSNLDCLRLKDVEQYLLTDTRVERSFQMSGEEKVDFSNKDFSVSKRAYDRQLIDARVRNNLAQQKVRVDVFGRKRMIVSGVKGKRFIICV